jgi:hypothetical protein
VGRISVRHGVFLSLVGNPSKSKECNVGQFADAQILVEVLAFLVNLKESHASTAWKQLTLRTV